MSLNYISLSKLLFICSKNQWRSPTAAMLFKNHAVHEAKSAGTSDKARIKINQRLLDWADTIFLMERKHLEIIKKQFDLNGEEKKVIVLDIPDEYVFGDEELIRILKNDLADLL